MAITFSRQNDAGSRACTVYPWENLVFSLCTGLRIWRSLSPTANVRSHPKSLPWERRRFYNWFEIDKKLIISSSVAVPGQSSRADFLSNGSVQLRDDLVQPYFTMHCTDKIRFLSEKLVALWAIGRITCLVKGRRAQIFFRIGFICTFHKREYFWLTFGSKLTQWKSKITDRRWWPFEKSEKSLSGRISGIH